MIIALIMIELNRARGALLIRENYLFGIEPNQPFIFGIKNFEFFYLTPI